MRSEASSDVFKVWLYAMASVLLGTWVSPLLYDAGKAIAEICATKQTNGPLEWLAEICRTTDFPGFFKVGVAVFAAILFLPFMHGLRGGRAAAGGNPWSFRLPESARSSAGGQRLVRNPHGLRQGVTGFFLVTALFLLIAGVMVLAGIFEWKTPGDGVAKLALRAFATALGLAVLQEILFRGIAMGIFLRAMRPAAALGLAAVLFALVHFLNPPPGLNVADPDAAGASWCPAAWTCSIRRPACSAGKIYPTAGLCAMHATRTCRGSPSRFAKAAASRFREKSMARSPARIAANSSSPSSSRGRRWSAMSARWKSFTA